jgi:hypothetical protein
MNINYGLLPPLEAPKRDGEGRRLGATERGRAKKGLISRRALAALADWAEPAWSRIGSDERDGERRTVPTAPLHAACVQL